jgi:oxygen-independent coproporphyrinogen-3 oxidase
MNPLSLAAYNRPVPRYTSYPTAAQFTPAIGPAEHTQWLRKLRGKSAALYIHVPFCQQLCWYCACHTMAMRRASTHDAYADALATELLRVAQTAPDLVLDGIQWGGGTPGHLGSARLRVLGRRIAALFDRRCDAEVSFEIDPRHCDRDLAGAIAEIGVTRVSLGIQDFDPSVQRAINRPQSFDITADTMGILRAAGVSRFNLDLVYGLPCQTIETLDHTLGLALELAPIRFAVFGYAHVPWMKPHQCLIDVASLPEAELRAEMAMLVARRLDEAGYVRIGLDHFARRDDRLARAAQEGRLRRNFQGYVASEGPWVVGVGASAISSLPGGFCQNTTDPARYMVQAARGFATARGVALTDDDRLRAEIIGQLMCNYRVDLAAACENAHVDKGAFVASIDGLPALEEDRLVDWDGRELTVTGAGRPLIRFVCAAFDRYYTGVEGRHSRGV